MCVRGLCVIGHLCVVSGYACLVSHVGLGGLYKTCGLHVFRMVHVFGGSLPTRGISQPPICTCEEGLSPLAACPQHPSWVHLVPSV